MSDQTPAPAPAPIQPETTDAKLLAIRWLTAQNFTNILLLIVIFCIAWGGQYAMTTAIPSHLRMIQTGYEYKDTQHEKERQRMLDVIQERDNQHREERAKTIEVYDRWLNHRMMEMDKKFHANANESNANVDPQE